MYLRSVTAALLAASALGFAACGGDDGDPQAAQSARQKARQAELAFARCMREQGIDFPDPQEGRGLQKVGGETTPEKMRAAEEACKKYREAIKPPELSEREQQEFKEAALAHSRCMREHGIDFPDPTFSEDGGAQIRIGKGAVNPNSQEFKAAEKACADKLGKPQVEG